VTYAQATAKLPDGAVWTASFGNPGEGGYCEYYRDANGNRYAIDNGPWHGPTVWTFQVEKQGRLK
jgi:hypothetical protein